jgi:hypothetical protein
MDEGEQFEKVEAAYLPIAKPLPDQRRIEEDVRRFRSPCDRFAPANPANTVRPRQPDAGMGGV